ncbi:MAG: RagB/SusD family nutrient uptake outer membrane protein [Cyclobacteriaceae bacterium]
MNRIKLISLALLIVLIAGCDDDFLEKTPENQLTQANFPETAADALAATNAMYELMRQSTYHRGFFPIDDIMSDDAHKGSNGGDAAGTLGPFERFQHTTTNPFVRNWWRTLYVGVRRTNVVLSRVPDVEMDEALKNRYLGEARFLRALYYSDLARAYGGVPLVTSSSTEANKTRSSLEQTYDLIEGDLRLAISLLPEKSDYSDDDLGRATRGAARALLSRVYLYQNQYDSAIFFGEEVIASGLYDLENQFEEAFDEAFEFGIESVFEIGGIGEDGGVGAGANEYALAQGVRGTPNRGFGFNRPTLDLINSFEANDPRMEATVIFLGETIDGITIIGDTGTPDETFNGDGELVERETYSEKIWTTGTTVSSSQGHNRRLIRYAEVLLNVAEAYANSGNVPQAITYLEEVRARARQGNIGILPEITETDPVLLSDLIIEERRHELAMEGFRFWDLVRTGKAAEVLGPLGFEVNKHELLPIPQTERDITQGALTQNPGWSQ